MPLLPWLLANIPLLVAAVDAFISCDGEVRRMTDLSLGLSEDLDRVQVEWARRVRLQEARNDASNTSKER